MTLMDKTKMWSRFRSISKALPEEVYISCGICGKQITEGEEDIEYVKTKRGTEIFVHGSCLKHW